MRFQGIFVILGLEILCRQLVLVRQMSNRLPTSTAPDIYIYIYIYILYDIYYIYIYENGEYVYKVLSNSSYNEKQTIESGENQIGCEMFLKCSFQRWKGEQEQKGLMG